MKLGNLLKKELKELLTPQAIFSMIFMCVLLIMMGQIMGTAMEDAINNSVVNIIDRDGSDFTKTMLQKLPEYGAEPKVLADDGKSLEELDINCLVIIPQGFGDAVMNSSEPAKIECIGSIKGTGLSSSMSDIAAGEIAGAIGEYVKDYVKTNRLNLSESDSVLAESPVVITEFTQANGKTLEVSSSTLSGSLMMQSMIAPLAVFFLVMMASQMIITAISTEKIDKTLETLLSAPVSRLTVLASKMIAAIVVALLNAGSMIVGMIFYMNGMTGSMMESEIAAADAGAAGDAFTIASAMQEFGFTLNIGGIIIFGIQLFLTIAIGLAISLILGATVNDTKSVQTVTLPIMMVTMIPFFVTMFADVNSLPTAAKLIMYIIPFTHTYTAMSNLMFGHTALLWGGLIYQLIFFAVCMYLAVKVFTTDLLFTMNLNFMKAKKKAGASGNENA